MARTTRSRRGVLLLVVLSMLVIFMLIAITFVVVSNQQRTAARAVARTAQKESRPSDLLDEAMYQLLRGTKNPNSVVRTHSLLRDMYGPDGFVSHLLWMPDRGKLGFPPNTATEIPDETGGQLIDLFVYDDPTVATDVLSTDGDPYQLDRTAGYYNGRVLTVAGGAFSGVSTRIVDYAYDSSNDVGRFRVLTFENTEGQTVSRQDLLHKANLNKLPTKKQYDPTLNVRLIVNGHPFNGSGTGYNRVTGRVDLPMFLRGPDGAWGNAGVDDNGDTLVDNLAEAGWIPSDDVAVANVPAALAPNRTDIAGGGIPPVADSSDESYDAPDFQNMALAAVVPTNGGPDYVLPSFHRPALINYWASQQPTVFNNPALRPFFLMRPLHGADADADGRWNMPEPYEDTNANRAWDATEPYVDINQNGNYDPGELDFTGKRTNLWVGPWDVDNDGDGVEDSIWIDLGMPARPGRDGRMVKPLFAILCVDLDGRINLNTHGTLPKKDPITGNILITANMQGPYANNSGIIPMQPLGQGFGPAEINPTFLSELSGNLNKMLLGSNPPSGRIDGRYGDVDPNGVDEIGTLSGEIRNRIDFAQLTYPNPPNPFDFFGRFPDVYGTGMVALDHGGYPLAVGMGLDHVSELRDNPYEIDLTRDAPRPGRRAAPDANPFTLYDLERLYRIFDKDAGALSSRLTGLLPSLVSGRLKVTTDSYDSPTASLQVGDNRFYILGPDGKPGQAGVDDNGDGQVDNPEETGWPRGPTNPGADDFQSIMGRPPINLAVVDLLKYKLRTNGVSAASVDAEIQKMLSPDLLAGLRMDINRAVGNGWDDNGNGAVDDPQEAYAPRNQVDDDRDGTVDEPDEMFPVDRNGLDDDRDGTRDEAGEMPANGSLRGETAWNPVADTFPVPAGFLDVPMDHNNDGAISKTDKFARQALAQHLFVLMMLVRDEAYFNWQQNETPALSNTDKQELTIRRIAQWAVNVVDFRDPDAIMTPFEYDQNPFNGWSVDGDPDTPDPSANRRVVWGCEHPELLLTETLAFHDRRVKDSDYDRGPQKEYGTGMNDDPDWDQPRVPQGSAFFELYCARGPQETSLPAELYELVDVGGGNLRWHLDLGRLAPPRNIDNNPYPVWRLAISGPTTAPNTGNNVLAIANARPESTSFEVNDLRLLSSAAPPTADERVDIERIVWLSNNSPVQGGAGVGTYQWQRIFYRRSPERLLPAGRYAVIGPWRGNAGHRTFIGSKNTLPWAPSNHEISIYPMVSATDNSGGTKYNYPNTAMEIQPAVGMVVAADPPATWTPPIGLSISEPLPTESYYPPPTHANEAYGDLTEMSLDPLDRYRDKPLDSDTSVTPLRPLAAEGKLATGTTLNHKTVFLQRLANPVLPWNPPPLLPDGVTPHPAHDPAHPVNPYRTVDWMPIDLTVFNGEDGTGATDPDDPNPDDAAMPVRFSSRQRGTNGPTTFNIWSNWTETNGIDAEDVGPRHNSEKPKNTDPDTGVPYYFQHNLIHTLGYLNDTFGTIPATRPPNAIVPVNMRDFVQTTLDIPDAEYRGSPKRPFPWLAWFNRPYANPLQVMLVPATSQARLLHEFTIGNSVDPYDAPGGTEVTFRTPYGHLLNFFHFETGAVLEGPHFYRILDLLGTRSPFVGTETILSPAIFAGAGNGRAGLHPPFNTVSNYRDPGRVNVNTIYSKEIWEAIRNGHALPFFGGVFQSRRGFNNGSGILNTLLPANDVLLARDTVPTFFANPFRAPGSGHLVPLPGVAEMDRESVDVYLTRSAGAGGGPPTGQPLMAFPALQQLTADYNNAQRNAYFRYAGMQRLSNLLTTRSNVYAVWITVGYFEVEPVPQGAMTAQEYQQRYPDGYRLVSEMGSESGDVERHRAFYVIDRSIPVAFEPGENHNVDEAVRLRRFIE